MNSITRTASAVDFEQPSVSVRVKIALAFLAIYVIWGSTFLATRYAVRTIPPFLVSGSRFFLGGLILCGVAMARRSERITIRMWASAALMGGLFFTVCHGGLSWGARHVPSGILALLMASTSLWTALIEIASRSRTRPGPRIIVSLVIGFVGIALLVIRPELLAGSHVGPMGAIVALIGAFSWAVGTVFTKRLPHPESTLLSAGMQMLCGGGLLLAAALVSGQANGWTPASISEPSAIAMVFLTLIGSLVGFSCYMFLLSHCPPTQVATYAYVNPIIALILGFMIGGEPISGTSLIASVVVIGSVTSIVLFRRPATAS
jgi:drug/metabolite transporter (DMT)-like permease